MLSWAQSYFDAGWEVVRDNQTVTVLACAACAIAVVSIRQRNQKRKRLERYDEIDLQREEVSYVSQVMEAMPYNIKWGFARAVWMPTILMNVFTSKISARTDWWNRIDETVILGALPFFTTVPDLHNEGVRGVINLCEEYSGPLSTYAKYHIRQLHIPTVDYTSPSMEHVEKALEFIEEFISKGESVYIHCKAGKGRSTTVVVAYLMKLKQLSKYDAMKLCILRRPQVSRYVWRRDVIGEIERKYDIPAETLPSSPLFYHLRGNMPVSPSQAAVNM